MKNQQIVGTGFVVDAQHILTCAHVVAAAGAAVGDTLRVGFAAVDQFRRATVLETAWRDREREDIALLKLNRPLPDGVTPALLWHYDTRQHPFASFGYVPLGDMQGIGARGTIITETTDKKGIPWLQLQSQQADKGLSGAPILDLETGRVVGMLSLTSNKEKANRDTCFATPISAIHAIWSDLPLTPPDPEPDTAPSVNVQISGSGTAVLGNHNTVIGAGSTVIGGDQIEHHYHLGDDSPGTEAPPLPPKGTLADVGGLPPGSRPVHNRYPTFTGREAELRELASLLLYDGEENAAVISQPAIASGMGGIGKSQLAVEFMYRYGRFFPGGVYWISFSDPDAIDTEIAACDGVLTPAQQATFNTLDLPAQTRLVRAAWQQPIPRLLIFDNLDDEQAVPLLIKANTLPIFATN